MKELNPKSGHSVPNTLTYNGTDANSTSEIAEIFNNYFVKLAESLISDPQEHSNTLRVLSDYTKSKLQKTDIFTLEEIDEDRVLSMPEKLNVSKSAGLDFWGPRLLKLAAPIVYKPIT